MWHGPLKKSGLQAGNLWKAGQSHKGGRPLSVCKHESSESIENCIFFFEKNPFAACKSENCMFSFHMAFFSNSFLGLNLSSLVEVQVDMYTS